MSLRTAAEASADLTDRADVEALLRRFYGRALGDEVLAEPFAELRATGLENHVPTMCDFWETVLFRAALYRGSALQAHVAIHRRAPLSERDFRRWLTLWHNTVDEMYRGPAADRAKVQAGRIAWAMHRRLTGTDAPELLVTPPVRGGRAPDRNGNGGR
ncbi:group III truncated hemoglobin [Mycobacterium sp. 94-17]|uniref:group III truncated hemoglobin n=1 Tax=Mycobacterium sp. 94-17 TaxID=2986147 RepID=UPI002D1EA366|nr:group III truncated hemoglobin [Mycobacterium sp. 94-17]MEB4210116.1 group III truncated hemoglobin [Mycobacterium sp. 94-17]